MALRSWRTRSAQAAADKAEAVSEPPAAAEAAMPATARSAAASSAAVGSVPPSPESKVVSAVEAGPEARPDVCACLDLPGGGADPPCGPGAACAAADDPASQSSCCCVGVLASGSMASSIVPLMASTSTCTVFVAPMRCARLMTCMRMHGVNEQAAAIVCDRKACSDKAWDIGEGL